MVESTHASAQRNVGAGPYPRLILRAATIIDGTGAPPYGPADVVVENNRITAIWVHPPTGGPRLQPSTAPEAGPGGVEIDLTGKYLLPGLIDSHGHIGWQNHVPNAQYVYDLWLAHGITTIREPGCFINGQEFTVLEAERSAANEIAAPRILPYVGFGLDRQEGFSSAAEAQGWVQSVAEKGAKGLKLWGYVPDILKATIEEAGRLGLGTMCHHQQIYISRASALDTARWGLGSIEHWYGIPEAMLDGSRLQRFPADYNYQAEAIRFAEAGRLWEQAAASGSERWSDTVDAFVETGVTLDPTFGVYVGLRDAARVQRQAWHERYTPKLLWAYWQPHSGGHGSFFDDWGTEQETAWRRNMRLWMDFVKEFHVRGGRVTVGTDPGSIFTMFGFAFPQEMELLREAGLTPLEIIGSATQSAADLVSMGDSIGSVEVGKLADLAVVGHNPLANLKRLYGELGELNDDRSGVLLTIKDGIVYDTAQLLERVRNQVAGE